MQPCAHTHTPHTQHARSTRTHTHTHTHANTHANTHGQNEDKPDNNLLNKGCDSPVFQQTATSEHVYANDKHPHADITSLRKCVSALAPVEPNT
eukprot:15462195-Alexandrium_andersonii.AAC.1